MENKQKLTVVWIVAIIISILSAFLSHVSKSSPAFQAEFSLGITQDEVNALSDDTKVHETLANLKHRSSYRGFLIESGRSLIIGALILLSIPLFNPDTFKTVDLKVMGACSTAVTILTLCLFWSWPDKLAKKPRVWHTLATQTEFWDAHPSKNWVKTETPPFYEWLSGANSQLSEYLKKERSEIKCPYQVKQWQKLYLKPYLWYLPYSLASFALLVVPLLVLYVKSTLLDIKVSDAARNPMEQSLSGEITPERINSLRPGIERSYLVISGTLNRYLWMTLLLVLVGLYEARLGHLTLSIFGQISFVLALGFLFIGYLAFAPQVLKHNAALQSLKYRLIGLELRRAQLTTTNETNLLKDISILKKGIDQFSFKAGNSIESISKLLAIFAGLYASIDQVLSL